MTSRNGPTAEFHPAEPALFSAVVTPHRSLSRAGFLIGMAAVGGISFVAGTAFLLLGAWPVFGFFGLDVLLVSWAFRANSRADSALNVYSCCRAGGGCRSRACSVRRRRKALRPPSVQQSGRLSVVRPERCW